MSENFSIIFVEPETAGNVGALARVMANFSLNDLIIVNPKCDLKSDECRKIAKHAYKIIENARIVSSFEKATEGFDFVIGSTGKQTSDYDATRTAYTPKEVKKNLQETEGKTAIVIGRESTGLSNEELSKCSFLVNIPTDNNYPVLNASHAAAIIIYEFSGKKHSKVRKADSRETEAMLENFNRSVEKTEKIRDKEALKKMFRTVVMRSTISAKETHALAGLFKEFSLKK